MGVSIVSSPVFQDVTGWWLLGSSVRVSVELVTFKFGRLFTNFFKLYLSNS